MSVNVRRLFCSAAALLPMLAAAQALEFPRYASAAQVDAECTRLLADLGAMQLRLQQPDGTGTGPVLASLDAISRRSEDTMGPLGLLASVDPRKPIRDAAEACDLKVRAFSAALLQDARLYALARQVQAADAIDLRMQRDQLDAFEDAGANLDPDQQARVQVLKAELSRLAQEFDRRILEDKTQVPFSRAELAGVPPKVWRAAKRDTQGRYLLGLDYPTSLPVIQRADNPASRERMWRATMSVGGDSNLKLLAQIATLRREYAKLFGFDSYADFALRRRMAQSETKVLDFLGEVKGAVRARELSDLAVLREVKAAQTKQDPTTLELHRWDLSYYTEKARQQRYGIDDEQFRAYFPPEASLKFVFALAERLFDVRITPLQQRLWHADARAYSFTDASTHRLLGTLFVDMYPRPDKYNHAAVFGIRSASTAVQRLPAAALVTNFDRRGLTIDELETLLHEFGHALHNLLSTTRYADGNSVQGDYVEAPSQMLEDWVYQPEVLALFQQVCATCKPMPAALIAKAEQARRFGEGIAVARQHLYASYDMAVYSRQTLDPMALWQKMEGDTPVGYEAGSQFPATFSHITEGYAAGYYGYLWSLVLAEDLRTAFAAHRLDPAVGRRYRDTVLSQGGQVLPGELIQQFLGRPTNSRAFFDALARR